jgi:hypothetical protein
MPCQGNHGAAGQRGEVDHMRRALLFGIRQQVGQHQAAFRVGVEHLDTLTVQGGEHIAGRIAFPPGMFSVAPTYAVT